MGHINYWYGGDVNLFSEILNTINKNTEAVLDTNKEVSPEANAEKSKYMFMFYYQNVGQNQRVKSYIVNH
jgi:hypothetical protein